MVYPDGTSARHRLDDGPLEAGAIIRRYGGGRLLMWERDALASDRSRQVYWADVEADPLSAGRGGGYCRAAVVSRPHTLRHLGGRNRSHPMNDADVETRLLTPEEIGRVVRTFREQYR
ncbi:hypothetical protein ACX4MT_01965 [Roseomonas mucosa]